MNDQSLPNLPVPAPPVDPPCEWCGERPAEPYEIAPPVLSAVVQTAEGKKRQKARQVVKGATMAYACKAHRDRFDQRKAEAAKKAAEERRRKREMKGAA